MLEQLKGNLIISCQALPDEPLYSPFIMGRMALAAKQAGAVAIRAQGVEDIEEIKRVTRLPIIGLIKQNYDDSEIYITATAKEVEALINSSCDIIALDATQRRRPHNESLAELVDRIKRSGKLALADISTDDEGIGAQALGFDCISTTLSGYTSYSPQLTGPDFGLLARMVDRLSIPVFAEGRINTPEDLKIAMECGAYATIVGSAITRPQLIAQKFAAVIQK